MVAGAKIPKATTNQTETGDGIKNHNSAQLEPISTHPSRATTPGRIELLINNVYSTAFLTGTNLAYRIRTAAVTFFNQRFQLIKSFQFIPLNIPSIREAYLIGTNKTITVSIGENLRLILDIHF
jgi:hypothetical protein